MKNKIRFDVISFHPGRQHNLEQAMQIANRINNYKHITSLYFSNHQVKNLKRVSSRIGGLLGKRSFSLDKKFVDINPWPEIRLLLLKRMVKGCGMMHIFQGIFHFKNGLVKIICHQKFALGLTLAVGRFLKNGKNPLF